MEENINIANILKDKQENTKLYSPLFGDVYFYYVANDLIKVTHHGGRLVIFFDNGRYYNYPESEPLLLPSKEMDDWRKFSWKKGDVLVSEGMGRLHVIFEGFDDDTYTTFKGKHYLCNYDDNEDYNEEEYNDYHKELILRTIEFKKDNVNDAKAYINTIEERFGGKLNLQTLEIEKQLEFKDFDLITIKLPKGRSLIGIFKAENDENYYLHANLDSRDIFTIYEDSYCDKSTCTARLSTEEERMHFFDALAKKGKTWDAVKKQIVDLKPKWAPKPFDRVITRTPETPWTANFFSHIDSDGIKNCIDDRYIMCLPYNDETAKLIGTTNNWRG